MKITKEAENITERIYNAYGSDTGVLFGISPNMKSIILRIVQLVLNDIKEIKEVPDNADSSPYTSII